MNASEGTDSFPIEGDLTHSSAGECYAQVVDRLLALENTKKQVLITSPGSTEGKTVTAVNLALAFNARRIPVLLIELSFKKARFARIFSPTPLAKGIESVLSEGIPLISTVVVRNDNGLSVAMVKNTQSSDDLIVPGPRLDQLLKDAEGQYLWTIIDAPSIASSSDIRSIAEQVGVVVLVARARKTRASSLKEAILKIAHPNLMVLLNDK